jgi:hypothetical protein
MAWRLSALCADRFLPPGRVLVLISVRVWVDPGAIVRLEGLGKLKKYTPSWTQTGDLPACSIVPQPTTLPRAPTKTIRTILIPYRMQTLKVVQSICVSLWESFTERWQETPVWLKSDKTMDSLHDLYEFLDISQAMFETKFTGKK